MFIFPTVYKLIFKAVGIFVDCYILGGNLLDDQGFNHMIIAAQASETGSQSRTSFLISILETGLSTTS